MFSGLKTALPMAFIVAMVSEMIGGADGIGHLLLRSQRSFDMPRMYAIVLVVAVTGGVLAHVLSVVESSCLRWYSGWKRACDRRCE
jgi:ABC-type nitrate/sulfonate/bicarbonate transport system permease component